LDEDRESDLRRLERRVRHEPRVIPQAFIDFARMVFLALQRKHLRGTGLAAARVRSLDECRGARALEVDASEGLLDEREGLGLECNGVRRLSRDLAYLTAPGHADRLDEVRLIRNSVRSNHGDRMRELNRRESVIALADARRDAVAEIPLAVLFAVLLSGEALPLPIARRQHAGKLALDGDAGLATQSELRQEPECVVDIRFPREDVVVRVAGDDDRLVHVDAPVPAGLVIVEAVRGARELEVTGIGD